MTEPFVRLAGSGRRADGALVTWTVAEGRRGRRWRESVVRGDVLVHSLLFETDPQGRFSHLELATPSGLVTLHPEGDGTLHGNVVRAADGVEHVVGVRFGADAVLLVVGSPIADAAAASRGASDGDEAVTLDPASLRLDTASVAAAGLRAVDGRGIPQLDEARVWSLEVADEP